MPSPELLGAFLLATTLICLAPGPDNLYVLAQSAQHGHSAGLYVTLGLCTGLVGHTTAVALGLAAVLQASATAFTVLKTVGALYLLYLAWQSWRASRCDNGAPPPKLSAIQLYRRGVIMNLSNPKVSLFFLAFLPQFIQPENDPVSGQFWLLGALVITTTLLVFSSIALLSGYLGRWLRSESAQRRLNQATGLLFFGLALKLLDSDKSSA